MQLLLRGPSLFPSTVLGGPCQCCLALVNAVRCDLITPTYLGVSGRRLARHKIDRHQGQASNAARAKRGAALSSASCFLTQVASTPLVHVNRFTCDQPRKVRRVDARHRGEGGGKRPPPRVIVSKMQMDGICNQHLIEIIETIK